MSGGNDITIDVPVLARVEGEGALHVKVRGGRIDELQLQIYEPPRLFEKFLEGRSFGEVPDAVARICGICPVAYQMSAVHAIEGAFGIDPGPVVRELRRLFYCGEWIESHALHVHLLALPDFFGYRSVIEMAADYPDQVRRGLNLQTLGNSVVQLLGARSVHPVGACVGGFHKAPSEPEVAELLARLRAAEPEAAELVRWVAALDVPDEVQEFTSVSLRHADEYPMNQGRLVSDRGLDIAIEDYRQHFTEFQVPHSTALHSLLDEETYLVGPLARLNLNLDRLPAAVRDNLAATGIAFPSRNMFHSALARAVEIHYAIGEAIRILENYRRPAQPRVDVQPRAGVGYGCTEAPRGILWHRYELDEGGLVKSAEIVPPTSQNQARIEQDLKLALERFGLDRDQQELRQFGEMVVRNYDPCISCATHFLKLSIDR